MAAVRGVGRGARRPLVHRGRAGASPAAGSTAWPPPRSPRPRRSSRRPPRRLLAGFALTERTPPARRRPRAARRGARSRRPARARRSTPGRGPRARRSRHPRAGAHRRRRAAAPRSAAGAALVLVVAVRRCSRARATSATRPAAVAASGASGPAGGPDDRQAESGQAQGPDAVHGGERDQRAVARGVRVAPQPEHAVLHGGDAVHAQLAGTSGSSTSTIRPGVSSAAATGRTTTRSPGASVGSIEPGHDDAGSPSPRRAGAPRRRPAASRVPRTQPGEPC